MNKMRNRAGFFIGAGLLLLAASALYSQVPVIESVVIRGDGRPGKEDLDELVSIREGETYSLMKIDRAVKQIYRTGLFADVRVLREGEERVRLSFILTRNLTVRNIAIEGGRDLPRRGLEKSFESLKSGDYFSEGKTAKAAGELKALLRRSGFFAAVVETGMKKNIAESSVDLTFKIGSWRRFRIGAVIFEGSLIEPESRLRALMKSRKGDYYIPSDFTTDIERLKKHYVSHGYKQASVEIAGEEFDDSTGLVSIKVRVLPMKKISFSITGADIPQSLLAPIWEEEIFEEYGLAAGEDKILTYLRKKGYVRAQVESRLEYRENEILAVYEIVPGRKFRINRVEFEGLETFSASRIRNEVGISEKMPFFALMDGIRLYEIPDEIERFYRENGFPDCRADFRLKSGGKAVTVVFAVTEGRRQLIGEITLSGIRAFPADEIAREMTSTEGGPFFEPGIQRDIERIENFYLNRGYRGTIAVIKSRETEPDVFALDVDVREGTKVRIGEIVITGNRITRRSAILREVRLGPGDAAAHDRILESKRRLANLGVFSEIRIEETPVSPEIENLVISVRESENNYAGIGAGVETRTEPRSLAIWENDLRIRGTAEFIRSNVFGNGSQLSLVGQLSLVEKRVVASFIQPYLFGLPFRTVTNVWTEEEDRKSFGFSRKGFTLSTTKPLSSNVMFIGSLTWLRTKLTYLQISESEVDRKYYPYSTSLVSGSLVWDRRDDVFNPTKGFFMSFVGEWAYPLFKTESDYLKGFFKFQYYYPLTTLFNFSLTSRLGVGRGKIPVPERFFAGGSNSYRGERFDELGPKDPVFGMPIGGKAMFLINLELKFPLIPNFDDLSGALFYDFGQVFSQRKDFSLFNFRGAVGFGLRYKTPLGPVRVDLGWNIDDPSKKGMPLLFITIGNIF